MRLAIFLLAAASAQASIVNLSNFQSSVEKSTPLVGVFNGFAFSTVTMGTGEQGEIMAYLTLGEGGYLSSYPVAQFISASASVDFTSPGFLVTSIYLRGQAVDDSSMASESLGLSFQSCSAMIYGSESFGSHTCRPDSGTESGTITAWMDMRTGVDVDPPSSNGYIRGPRIEMTLKPNPEPGTLVLLGGALILLVILRWKK